MTATYAPPASAPSGRPRGFRALIATSAMIGALFLVGNSVFAGLNATATAPSAQTFNSGTLKLVMTANGAGFTTNITKMVPGDKEARFVTLENTGTLEGYNLTFTAVLGEAATKLASDATNGLQVQVWSCPSVWTGTSTWDGTCSGTQTKVLDTSLNNLRSNKVALSPLTLPLTTSPSSGRFVYLKVIITLPNQNETTDNGTLPAGTIQGLTQTITWTFEEEQRTATQTAA